MAQSYLGALHATADRTAVPLHRAVVARLPRVSFEAWVAVAAVLVSAAVRFGYVGMDPFPLHDGGLFLVMIEEIIRNGFALPYITSYNGDGIPFAYPPFGLYLAALVVVLTGADPTTVIARVPALLSVATVPAFYFLARTATGNARAAAFATCFFGLMPSSFTWIIMGGGATRAPGYLLSVAAMAVMLAAFRSGQIRTAISGGVLFGLAALSHAQFAWYAVFMLLVAFLFRVRCRAAWKAGVVGGVAAVLVVTPWLAITVGRHGPEPLARAFATNGFADARQELSIPQIIDAQYDPVFSQGVWTHYGGAVPMALGLVGVAVSVWWRRPLAAAWFVLLPLAGSRAGPQVFVIPLACLCGLAVEAWWRLLVRRVPGTASGLSGPRRSARRSVLPPRVGWAAATAILVAILGFQTRIALADPLKLLSRLTPDERASMHWVAEHTPPDSRFVVMRPRAANGWWDDRVTEWFPVLAERTSLATPQGREWLIEFRHATRKYQGLQDCLDATSACLEGWEKRFADAFSHVYIPKDGSEPRLRRSLDGRDSFELAYDGPGAWIYRRR